MDIILRLIFDTFLKFEVSRVSGILTMKVNGQWVPCVRNSSYSFIPVFQKPYICLEDALKICRCFGYNLQIICYTFFSQFDHDSRFSGGHFDNESEWIVGTCTLCAQLLQQFNFDSFETLQMS